MPGFLKNLLPSCPFLFYCLLSLGNFRQRLYVRKFLAGSTQFTQTTSAESFNMGSLGILVVDTNNLRAHTPRGRVESRPPPRGRPNIRAFFPLRALLLVLLVGVLHRGVGLSSAQLAQRRVDCAREVFVFSRFQRSWAHVGGFPILMPECHPGSRMFGVLLPLCAATPNLATLDRSSPSPLHPPGEITKAWRHCFYCMLHLRSLRCQGRANLAFRVRSQRSNPFAFLLHAWMIASVHGYLFYTYARIKMCSLRLLFASL